MPKSTNSMRRVYDSAFVLMIQALKGKPITGQAPFIGAEAKMERHFKEAMGVDARVSLRVVKEDERLVEASVTDVTDYAGTTRTAWESFSSEFYV